MYGLVNKALQEWTIKEHGQEIWRTIKSQSDLETELFVNMQTYDDAITYNMVGKASEITNIPAGEILESLGQFWIEFTAEQGYGKMLRMAGNSFPAFLKNLNNLHERVGSTYHDLQPPGFTCIEVNEKNLILKYESDRDGLSPMVVGLLKGLAKRFNIEISLQHTKTKEEVGYDEFNIQIVSPLNEQLVVNEFKNGGDVFPN